MTDSTQVRQGSITGSQGEVLVFLHITKTGGRTLEAILRKLLKSSNGVHFDLDGSLSCYETFMNSSIEFRDSFDVLYGHFHFGIHDALSSPCKYVTMLRDPVDRVISHYYHVLEEPRHYLHEEVTGSGTTFAQYVKQLLPRDADNGAVRALNRRLLWNATVGDVTAAELVEAKRVLQEDIEVFGITERFDESLMLMASRFGWPDEAIMYERRNTTRTRPTKENLDSGTLEAIEKVTSLEQELYDWAVSRFEDVIAQQPPAFHDRVRRFQEANPGSQAKFNREGVRIDGLHCTES